MTQRAITTFALLLAFFVPLSASAVDCSSIPGTRPATAADAAVINGRVEKGACYNPDDDIIGQAAESAKEWLRQHASKGSIISCLDAEFAQKLKKFMEAVPGGPPTIISAYRPPEAQVALVKSGASKAGPCQSYHNYGLAVDFNNTSRISWMRANSQGYGINIIGAWDPNHFQDARGRFGQCGKCSNYKGDGTLAEPPGGSGGLSGQIRQALGMQQQPPMPPQPTLPSQPTPPTPTQPTISGQINTTTQTYVSPDMSKIPSVSDIINANAATNTNKNTKDTSTATSAFDLIDAFLESDPVSGSIDIGKAVAIDLNPDTNDAISLIGRRPTSTLSGATSTLTNSQSLSVPQTFTSGDLANNFIPTFVGGQNTFALQILNSMKKTLLLALSYLRPFGGAPGGTVSE
ncbi:hypothetical protein HY971_03515 [Candidatus Kaiserbacteria bacterium]|nr:hypothetical protein [Candidatus Kaiserbacteria bacterium]